MSLFHVTPLSVNWNTTGIVCKVHYGGGGEGRESFVSVAAALGASSLIYVWLICARRGGGKCNQEEMRTGMSKSIQAIENSFTC